MTTHPCPAPRCQAQVQRDRLACRKHWFQLPADLRTAIWEAWEGKDESRHRVLIARAVHLWIVSAAARARLIETGGYSEDVG